MRAKAPSNRLAAAGQQTGASMTTVCCVRSHAGLMPARRMHFSVHFVASVASRAIGIFMAFFPR
jgi:hypothetical protein